MQTDINIENIDSIIKVIESNESLIQYDYKDKENQILITKTLVDKIYALMSDMKVKKSDFKELMKQSIKKGFELSSSDIVISKSNEFFIKLFDKTKKHQVDEKDKDTIASRYNGIDEEELEQFYDEFFAEDENKNFFTLVAMDFVDIYLKDEKISNVDYEKNVFSYIHAIAFERLVEMYDDSDGFFTGFAGYIFRIHFKEVFEYIADLILDEISIANTHMIEFLKYYSLNIIVVGGKKYKVPALETSEGLKWNVGSMLSIAKIYTKSKRVIKSLKKDSLDTKAQIKKLYVGDLTPMEYQASIIQKRKDFEEAIAYKNKELEKYSDTLDLANDEEERQEVKRDMHLIKETINRFRQEKSNLSKVVISQSSIRNYTQLQKDIDSITRQLKREQLVITQNKDSYQSIRKSLIKALISKKQLL